MIAVALPLMRRDLGLDYAQIGLLLALPTILGTLAEPAFGILADAGHRRALILAGGVASALVLVGNAVATTFPVLLVAFVLGAPSYGAFVSLGQAALMDAEPETHERSMARWVLAGSIGVTVGPLLFGAAMALGLGWRHVFWALAVGGLALVVMVRNLPISTVSPAQPTLHATKGALQSLRSSEVRRWLVVLQASDLMIDVLFAFLALYLVDVAGATPAQAGLGVALWSIATIAGSAMLLPMLERVDSIRYLRVSAIVGIASFVVLLMSDELVVKFVAIVVLSASSIGWYTIPKGRLYSALPGRSGTVVTLYSATSFVGGQAPLALGALAGALGLADAMWFLLAGPIVLLLLTRTPRR